MRRFQYQTYQLDSYQLFLERSICLLLREGGYYGMIIPNPWLTNLLQTKIRLLVTRQSRICEIVHFRFPVFPSVTVDTEIVILQKKNPSEWRPVVGVYSRLNDFITDQVSEGREILVHEQARWEALEGGVINIFMTPADTSLAGKCTAAGVPLESLAAVNVGIKPYQAGKGKPPKQKKPSTNGPSIVIGGYHRNTVVICGEATSGVTSSRPWKQNT